MSAPTVPVSLAHHWLVGMRGGEKVLEQLCLLFPGAPIHTLVARLDAIDASITDRPVHCSPLQSLGGASYYKPMLPLFPMAVRRLAVPDSTQFVFSTDASVIKGLSVPDGVPHVCYCHSPPRYLWDMQDTYLSGGGASRLARGALRAATPYVRRFDARAAAGVTDFIANSEFVRRRIHRSYGRDATVIHPPVDVDRFDPGQPADDYYLIVSELVPYKRIDLAVEAFTGFGRRLVVVGSGPESAALSARAPDNVEFLGRLPFADLKRRLEGCRAFLYPQVEDFGITAVEAQAAGRPVIALRHGGAVESVLDGATGVFFDEQTPEALRAAVLAFERLSFDSATCRANAERFDAAHFRAAVTGFLEDRYPAHFGGHTWPL